ncbi:Negative elongation factor B [Myotis brandtii]|uniref:Negative elongation factor B n=1 Tax=Myotis brandtii TaxID=109478 RepID=S7Q2E3_MYOBR|nr:Negative elongation factor B [Myotis brandtii]
MAPEAGGEEAGRGRSAGAGDGAGDEGPQGSELVPEIVDAAGNTLAAASRLLGGPCAFCVAPSEQNRPRADPLLPQTENGVLLPSLQSALPFLDLHGTPRLEFHQSVFDELREKLLERVSAIAAEGKAEERYKKLEDLLEKSFSLVKMPSLQPVVMCVMKHLPKVPEKKLKLVMADKELYRACAVEVKRQIWQDNQALFGDEVSPLLKQYILEKERALFSTELSVLHNFFSPSPRTRRQGEVVQKLTQMVGKNVKLYNMVLQFLWTLFLRTRNAHYCTLRAELLMSLHDLDVGDICSVDPCHKFTWCLDACIRDRFVDSKRARELQGFLDGVKKGQEQVLGDLSMILCDPFAINTLSLSTLRHLQELVGQETLPRDSPDLLLLLRLLALGQGAWDMIDSQVFKEPRMEVELITKFLPTLMSFMVDDFAFNVDQKLPAEERAPAAYPSALPESFTRFLQEQRMACEVGLYYVLHITKQRNKNALLRLLPGLVETFRLSHERPGVCLAALAVAQVVPPFQGEAGRTQVRAGMWHWRGPVRGYRDSSRGQGPERTAAKLTHPHVTVWVVGAGPGALGRAEVTGRWPSRDPVGLAWASPPYEPETLPPTQARVP